MKVARITIDGVAVAVSVEGNRVVVLEGNDPAHLVPTDRVLAVSDVRCVAPVVPTKVVLAGDNFRVTDQPPRGKPLLIATLPPSAVAGPDDEIEFPEDVTELWAEPELAAVVGRVCRRASEDEAADAILGLTCANDLTAFNFAEADEMSWARAKGIDGFYPTGPWIVTDADPEAERRIRCRVNGELVVDANSRDLRFGPAAFVSYVSQYMTLQPGDVVSLGAPPGPVQVVSGDVIEVDIDGIGVLRNSVVERRAADV